MKYLKFTLLAAVFFFTFLASSYPVLSGLLAGLSEQKPLIIDEKNREVRLLAELDPDAFQKRWLNWTPGHHAVVWNDGAAAGSALFRAYAPDADVHDALVAIGGKPGNNLTRETWEKRKDPDHPDPKKRVEGSPVEVLVWWKGLKEPVPLGSLFTDPMGKEPEFRFGGHKHLIPVWRSGCIVCLQSCPGGKVSNRAHTMREYALGKAAMKLKDGAVPEGTRKAVVILKVKEE